MTLPRAVLPGRHFFRPTATAALAALKAQDPPHLDAPMPTLPEVYELDNGALVARYNAVVYQYNTELLRRQRAQAALLPSVAQRLARRIAAAKGVKVTIRGEVEPLPDLAARSYQKAHRAAPGAHIREVAAGGATFAETFYKKTRYCVTSQPPGAAVTRNGEDVGLTPVCLDDVATSEPFELSLKRDGYPVVGTGSAPVRASVSNVTEVDCTFSKVKGEGSCRGLP